MNILNNILFFLILKLFVFVKAQHSGLYNDRLLISKSTTIWTHMTYKNLSNHVLFIIQSVSPHLI